MRENPTARIPLGILGLLGALAVYVILVATLAPPLIGDWPTLAQVPVYLVLGVIWLLPLRRFLIWMETGRWN
jgi:hypothetical protein